MSNAHNCLGCEGVSVGVSGAVAFLAWNVMHVSHCQPASSIALLTPWRFTMTIYWGCMQQCIMITRSVDSPGQQFLDPLDQASWCHAGMARSSWLHRCGMGCNRHWCWGILLNSWCDRTSWSLLHLGCQWCRYSRCGLHAWCRLWQCRLCH